MKPAPMYCPCQDDEPATCPACGATVSGNDPFEGRCQARHQGPEPRALVNLVLIDKRTGEIVASTS